MRKSLDELGELQRAVIEVLWKEDGATVHQVRDALAGERRPAYTTILSVLQKLEKNGWVAHRKEGRTYVYTACRSRGEEGANSLRSFVDKVFAGQPTLLFEHLIQDERIGAEELDELRRMIEKKREASDDS